MPADRDAFQNGRFRVMAKRCDECLLSSAKIVGDRRRDQILAGCRRTGEYFLCRTMRGEAIVCRGFFDTEPNRSCQVAERLGLVELVEAVSG